MSNFEHISKFKAGTLEWNLWRDNNPKIKPDLSGLDVHGETIGYGGMMPINLRNVDLKMSNLRNTKMEGAFFEGADITGANLSGADLNHCKFSGANLHGANLSGAHLHDANFTSSNLVGVNFDGAFLSNADFRLAKLDGASLVMAYIEGAKGIDQLDLEKGNQLIYDIRNPNQDKFSSWNGSWSDFKDPQKCLILMKDLIRHTYNEENYCKLNIAQRLSLFIEILERSKPICRYTKKPLINSKQEIIFISMLTISLLSGNNLTIAHNNFRCIIYCMVIADILIKERSYEDFKNIIDWIRNIDMTYFYKDNLLDVIPTIFGFKFLDSISKCPPKKRRINNINDAVIRISDKHQTEASTSAPILKPELKPQNLFRKIFNFLGFKEQLKFRKENYIWLDDLTGLKNSSIPEIVTYSNSDELFQADGMTNSQDENTVAQGIAKLREYVEKYPSCSCPYTLLAQALSKYNQVDDAEVLLLNSFDNIQKKSNVAAALGDLYFFKKGNLEKAIEWWVKSVSAGALSENDWGPFLYLSGIYDQYGSKSHAQRLFNVAEKARGNSASLSHEWMRKLILMRADNSNKYILNLLENFWSIVLYKYV